MSPLTVDGALTILGLRRGRALTAGPVSWEWEVAGNDLIARARAGDSGGPYVEIAPAPRLALSFEDLAPAFIDAPYFMDSTTGHLDEDTLHAVVTSNYHIFRVAAGELRIRIPSLIPAGTPMQMTKARQEGYATGMGVNPRREPVEVVLMTVTDRDRGAQFDTTLRQRREIYQSRAARAAARASQATTPATTPPKP
jgi:hypothetical protein